VATDLFSLVAAVAGCATLLVVRMLRDQITELLRRTEATEREVTKLKQHCNDTHGAW
jgi:cell division protein FtsB